MPYWPLVKYITMENKEIQDQITKIEWLNKALYCTTDAAIIDKIHDIFTVESKILNELIDVYYTSLNFKKD